MAVGYQFQPCENSVRPAALGGKKYPFASLHDAVQQAAMMHSFFGASKLMDTDPLQWLRSAIEKFRQPWINRSILTPLLRWEFTSS